MNCTSPEYGVVFEICGFGTESKLGLRADKGCAVAGAAGTDRSSPKFSEMAPKNRNPI